MVGKTNTTSAAVQRFLADLAGVRGDSPVEPIVRDLIARSAHRLSVLCTAMLHRNYPRLTRPPVNIQSDELLSALVERLLKALREARPTDVQHFFAFANQHIRWELNTIARRLDEQDSVLQLRDSAVGAAPPAVSNESSAAKSSPAAQRILHAIDELPDEERETFSLVRIQGMTHSEAADILGISTKTVQRRLHRSVALLAQSLGDLGPR